jgi:hypothetical protein
VSSNFHLFFKENTTKSKNRYLLKSEKSTVSDIKWESLMKIIEITSDTVEKYQHYLHGRGLLGSEKQWLWELTCYVQKWNAQIFLRKAQFHTEKEAKWTSELQKIHSFPATISHFPAETTFWSKLFHNQMSLGVFQSKIFHGNESRKILLWRLFRLLFAMKFYMPNMWTY